MKSLQIPGYQPQIGRPVKDMPDEYRDWVSALAIAAMSLDITSMVLLLLFWLYGTKKKLASWAKPNGRKLDLGMNYQG